MNMMKHIVLFIVVLYISNPSFSYANDICVAKTNINTPSGYECKPQETLSVEDFVFSGFVPGETINPFNVKLTVVSADKLRGLNGLGLSAARVDISINGTVAMHVHPDESEFLMMVQGKVTAGFVTSEKAYVKDIKVGDVFVFPKGQLHFVVNSGSETAIAFVAYSSSTPTFQFLDDLLFGKNNLNTSIIAQTTLLDVEQIKKLKAQFGGSG
ncbi:germin-like protein [Trifolium medium]|uniref:Germin-like protein n=1 Tax=Trifolium medium TaxID=97028 RepID=A0A392N6N6_9FABA|nr:germin-like protein [Trifolium medium]